MTVIVSAYLKIPSKASHEFYLSHLNLFFNGIKSNIVFFTTADLIPLFSKMRGNLPIDFQIINSINDLVAFEKYG